MSEAARRTVLVVAAVCILSACNGTLRFDETPLDGGSDGLDALDRAPDSSVDAVADGPSDATDAPPDAGCLDAGTVPCGWLMAACQPDDDDTCERYCPAGLVCTNGACGTGCVADCRQDSTCAIATGDVSRVECKTGASCTATLGAGSNATCAAGSSCQVRCAGRCAISCQLGATCQLRCGDATDFTTVTGTASCP